MNPIIYFDLDGVLANFCRGAFTLHNRHLPMQEVKWDFDKQLGIDPPAFWAPMGREFWANLEPYADGMLLLADVARVYGRDRIELLSSPCDTAGCRDGKQDWVEKHLPDYKRSLTLTKQKWKFAGPGKLLLDDSDVNLAQFVVGPAGNPGKPTGGKAIRIPRPWNSARDLWNPVTESFAVHNIFALLLHEHPE